MRFVSKTGIHKANVLRLALLPFLREHRGESAHVSVDEYGFRIKVLKKWWIAILMALNDRTVSGSDRSAYLEGISGLLSRQEWVQQQEDRVYASLLCDTLRLVIQKLCLKSVPLAIAAFSGKVLAYSFFWVPGVAPVLLHMLGIQQSTIDRITSVSFPENGGSDDMTTLENAISLVKSSFPAHLEPLVGKADGINDCNTKRSRMGGTLPTRRSKQPEPPNGLTDLYGPWSRRWTAQNSDVFFAFLKHYYSIMSSLLPAELPWNAHLATPGLIILHASILRGLDFVVHQSINPRKLDNDFNVKAVSPVPAVGTRRRVDQLKIMATLREILHNDDGFVQFYEPYCRQFERILHSVALQTSLYDVESCIVLADLVEEYLSSLILTYPWTENRVKIQKDRAIDWEFWIRVVQKMLSSGNCHTEIRAFSFLFNLWDNIPISSLGTYSSAAHVESLDEFDFHANDEEGLRWNCTVWLLSPPMWKRYFCHWQPLVRSYYHRLLCWRVASVGPESDLLSSILFSNYNADARALLSSRLDLSYRRLCKLRSKAKAVGDAGPALEPAPPVVHRKLSIIVNMAASPMRSRGDCQFASRGDTPTGVRDKIEFGCETMSSVHLHRTNPFDVFDEIAYSYPAMPPPADTFLCDNNIKSEQPRHSHSVAAVASSLNLSSNRSEGSLCEMFKKMLAMFRGRSIKRYFSTGSKINANLMETKSGGSSRTSMSTPSSSPSRSPAVGSNFAYGDLNRARASMMIRPDSDFGNVPPIEPLTISLIPPPPQLLRTPPEISRSKFKFALEYCESSYRKQLDLIMHKKQSNTSKYMDQHSRVTDPVRPRLPFEFSHSSSGARSVLNLYSSESHDEDSGYVSADEKSTPNSPVPRPILYERDEDVKYWKYSGRSLSEWEKTVREFEDFVRSRQMLSGATRLEDIEVPFMVAEIPLRALAG